MTARQLFRHLAACNSQAEVVIIVQPKQDDYPLHLQTVCKPKISKKRIFLLRGHVDDRAVWE